MDVAWKNKTPSTARLRLWRTVLGSYAQWFQNFSHVARATTFWVFLVAISMGVADWLNWSVAVTVLNDLKSRNPKPPDFRAVVAIVLYCFCLIVLTLALVDIAVSWHRRVILYETPRLFGGNLRHAYYWKYFLRLLLVLAVAGIPLIIIFGLVFLDGGFEPDVDPQQSTDFDYLVLFMGSFILITVAVIFVRLSLTLPAAATNLRLTWVESIKSTRGNTWRLIVGLFLCGIAPGSLIDLCLEWAGFDAEKMSAIEILITTGSSDLYIRNSIYRQILAASTLIVLPIGVKFFSSSYQQLVRKSINETDAR